VQKVQLNAERRCRRNRGNLWVKTCFLVKGLSPSKLSTKALCGNTRKRGNERPERACRVKARLETELHLWASDLDTDPEMLALENFWKDGPGKLLEGELKEGSLWDQIRNR